MDQSESHSDMVLEFISITQADPEVAKKILSDNNWDMTLCVEIYLENPDQFKITQINEEYVRPPIESKKMRLVDPPVSIGHKNSNSFMPSVINTAFRDLKKEYELMHDGKTKKKPVDLADLFRPPFDILFQGTYEQAQAFALNSGRYLIVNIQSESEFNSQILNRDTWSNRIVKDLIKASFVMWQAKIELPSTKNYVKKHKVKTAPHIAIVDPKNNKILERWDEFVSPEDLIGILETYQPSKSGPIDESFKHSKDTVNILDLTEEEQLEEAIKRSMIINDDNSLENLSIEEEYISDDETNKKRNRDDFDNFPEYKKFKPGDDNDFEQNIDNIIEINDEPVSHNDNLNQEESEEENNEFMDEDIEEKFKTTLRIIFPDNTHITKIFNCNDKILKVFNFVKKMLKTSNFTIVATYPRMTYTRENAESTLLSADLYPRAIIRIELDE